jgi:hypothetical protein
MTVNLDVLRQHRDALLLAEVAAWLHNIGKMDPNFLVMQTGESPDEIPDSYLYRIIEYSFRRFASPSVLQGTSPYAQKRGVLYFPNRQLREEIKQIKEEIANIHKALKDQSLRTENRRNLGTDLQLLQQEGEQKEKALEQEEQKTWQKYENQIEQCMIPDPINWPLGSLLTMFWEEPERFDKPQVSGYEPGSSSDPDYQRQPKPGIYLNPGFTMDLPALLLLSHGEVSGQEKTGVDAQGKYVGVDDYHQNPPLSLDGIRIASAFGYETDIPWKDWQDQRKEMIDWVLKHWDTPLQLKADLRQRFAPMRNTLGDTQRPINEISLWDYSWAVAALFKTAVARAVIAGNMPTPADMHWRLVSVRLDALDFLSRSHQIADLIARHQLLENAYQIIRWLLEVEIPIGTSVYSDENGIVFVVPEIPGWSDSEIQEALSAQIYNALDAPQSMETATFPALYGAADLRPSVQVGPARRGKKLQLQEVLHQEAPLSMPNPDEVQKWWQGATGERCVICGLRPQGYIEPGLPAFVQKTKARERHLCGVCLARRGRRAEEWAGRPDETIWIDEVADVNGRIALIVGRFDLDHWIDGTMVRSLAIGTDQNGNWLAKPPTFARIQRVWRTTAEFWESVQSETIQQLKDDRRRLCLWLNGQPDLGHYHTYELNLGLTTLSVVWVPPRDGQEWYLISADNLQYVAKQLGAEESIYKHAASSCIFVEDVIQRELVQKNREPELQNPESLPSERGKNLLKGYRLKSTDHQDVAYSTAIPILAEPRTFMALVPADRALEVVKAIKSKYEREMGKVRNRLPLTLGVVYFGRRIPLAAALDAGRRMLQRPAIEVMCKVKNVEPPNCTDQNWPRERRITLELNEQEITLSVPTVMGDGQTHDVWYPYWRVEGRPTNRTRWFIGPDSEHWVHICDLEPGDQVSFLPSTFDYEFLDTTTRRFEVSYDASGQRRSQDRRQRPYLLEELDKLEKAWKDISHLSKSQIHAVIAAMETKRHVWEKPVGAGALALPDQDVFRQFVRDTLRESGVWSEPLERAALNGMLRDALEIHLEIMKEELK